MLRPLTLSIHLKLNEDDIVVGNGIVTGLRSMVGTKTGLLDRRIFVNKDQQLGLGRDIKIEGFPGIANARPSELCQREFYDFWA